MPELQSSFPRLKVSCGCKSPVTRPLTSKQVHHSCLNSAFLLALGILHFFIPVYFPFHRSSCTSKHTWSHWQLPLTKLNAPCSQQFLFLGSSARIFSIDHLLLRNSVFIPSPHWACLRGVCVVVVVVQVTCHRLYHFLQWRVESQTLSKHL